MLSIGFTLVILFLTIGGTIAFRSIVSIRNDVDIVFREENVNRRLIEELRNATEQMDAPALARIEAEARPGPDEKPLWDSLLRAAQAFSEASNSPDSTDRERFLRRQAVISAISALTDAGFARVGAAESGIDFKVGAFTGQSVALLFASLGLALVCSVFTIHATRRLFRDMAWQENELGRVSWQMLADQESIAQRFSHELHDELGQTLAALRANLTSAQREARATDSIALTDEAIGSVRQLSHLLRPTILDDFGLDAGLAWLCEGFMQRTGIEVAYRSEGYVRLAGDPETHLFRIAQEALTNVSRHSGATKVMVSLIAADAVVRLRIADNGKGVQTGDSGEKGFGMTGMRARARVAGGTFRVSQTDGGGLTIEVTI